MSPKSASGPWPFPAENYFGGVIGTLSQKDATTLIARSLEARVNFIDTANVYSLGRSEKMTGQALKDLGVKRSDVVLATKVFGRMAPGPNDIGASRGHIMDSVSQSLERLQTDHIDLYQIHQSDSRSEVEETMRALDDLVRQGMIRYVGVSNWEAWKIMKANGIADKRGLGPGRNQPGLLLHRRPRPGTGPGADDAGPECRLPGVEPAGGRLSWPANIRLAAT